MRLLVVQPAEKSLADFERENAKKLEQLPKLKRAEEPEFVPHAPENEWDSAPLTPLQVLAGGMDDGEFDVDAERERSAMAGAKV